MASAGFPVAAAKNRRTGGLAKVELVVDTPVAAVRNSLGVDRMHLHSRAARVGVDVGACRTEEPTWKPQGALHSPDEP